MCASVCPLLSLLSGSWRGSGSVALDPIPKLDAGTPLTTTSRERSVRFLCPRETGKIRAAAS